MAALPESLQRLVGALSQLPGIGPRSAERLALHLVQREPEAVKVLATALLEAREKVQACNQCGGLTEIQPCPLCADPRRDASLLCVVETPVDILRLEKAGAYRGLYHVLGGRLSPTTGIEPEDLRIAELEARVAEGAVREVILALGSDVESDATCYYLARRLAGQGVQVTRLAQGLPAGAGLELADEITLSRALEGRRQVE
ncbi:MAG: recombination mediator RecR [Verrucomicrobiae bacterium]|nr:recombination mediator RecR [Verrucomicrobiae bacterium]